MGDLRALVCDPLRANLNATLAGQRPSATCCPFSSSQALTSARARCADDCALSGAASSFALHNAQRCCRGHGLICTGRPGQPLRLDPLGMTSRAHIEELHRIDELLPQLGRTLGCGPRRAAAERSTIQHAPFPDVNPGVVTAEFDAVLELYRLHAQNSKADMTAELMSRCACAPPDVKTGCQVLGLSSTVPIPAGSSRIPTTVILQAANALRGRGLRQRRSPPLPAQIVAEAYRWRTQQGRHRTSVAAHSARASTPRRAAVVRGVQRHRRWRLRCRLGRVGPLRLG